MRIKILKIAAAATIAASVSISTAVPAHAEGVLADAYHTGKEIGRDLVEGPGYLLWSLGVGAKDMYFMYQESGELIW